VRSVACIQKLIQHSSGGDAGVSTYTFTHRCQHGSLVGGIRTNQGFLNLYSRGFGG
jgi:hypothetical protein